MQVLKLKGLPFDNVKIINVYTLDNPSNRSNLWELIKEKIQKNCHQIFCKNLNIVECHMDKLSLCGKLILEKEKLSWEALKSTLYIQELLGFKEV